MAVHTILLADDEPDLLELMAQSLAEPGYTILTAGDGYEAIRILADRHVDLLVTDVRMPGLDGIELAIQAKVMRPYLRVVYVTGFSTVPADGRILRKPFRPAELRETVREEISGKFGPVDVRPR
jgi:CheY-like chemotaxis protein